MKHNKFTFGIELLKKLRKEPFDIVKLSRWCEQLYSNNIRNLDQELKEILFELSTMEDDPQFERTQEELEKLAEKLICEDAEFLNLPEATILDNKWLMCPNCIDAWESNSKKQIVICPKCETTFRNPRFKKNDDNNQ